MKTTFREKFAIVTITQKIAASTVAQIAGRFVQAALGLATVALLTRYLGVQGYGEYSIIFAFTGLAAVAADFGATTLIIREATQRRASQEALIGSGVVASVIIGALVTVTFAITAIFMPYSAQVKNGIWIALVAVFIGNLNIYGSYFSIRTRLDKMVLIETLGRVVSVGAIAALVFGRAPFIWIIIAAPLGMAFNASFGTWLVVRGGFRPTVDARLVRHILIRSLPIGLIYVLGVVQYRVDAVILSLMRPAADVAVYSLATKIAELLAIVPAFFVAASYPTLSAAYTDPKAFRDKSRRVFGYLAVLGLPVVTGAYLIAPRIVNLLGSAALAGAATPLRILCGSVLLGYIGLFFSNIALAAGLQRRMIWRSGVVVAVTIVANVYLIPIYGSKGSAAAAVIANLTAVILAAALFIRRHILADVDLLMLGKIMFSLVIMASVIWASAKLSTLAITIVAALAYGGAIWLTGAVKATELKGLIK